MPNKKDLDLHCAYQNVRGLNTKLNTFYVSASYSDYDVIGVTESWCTPAIASSEIFDNNQYSVYRQDRNMDALNVSRGGGVILAIKRTFNSTRLDLSCITDEFVNVDVVGCKMSVRNQSICIFVVYVQPGLSTLDYESFFDSLQTLDCMHGDRVLIMGDFNIAGYVRVLDDHGYSEAKCSLLFEFLGFFSLEQHNRVTNSHGRILDLLMSNTKCRVVRGQPFVSEDSHHPFLDICVTLDYECSFRSPFNCSSTTYNFCMADLASLYGALGDVNWEFLGEFGDVDEASRAFYNVLYSILDSFVPIKGGPSNRTFPVWYTREIIANLKYKNQIYRKFKKTGSEYHLSLYKNLRSDIKLAVKLAYDGYVAEVQRQIKDNPTRFWSFVQSKNSGSRIPENMIGLDGTACTSLQDIVDEFARYFSGFYTASLPAGLDFEESLVSCGVDSLSCEEVLAAMQRLKPRLTCGPDLVPSFLIRDCAAVLCHPLTKLYNLALRSNTFPSMWKVGRVCPIFKKGSKEDITNYRPITILSNFSKVFESVLYARIYVSISPAINCRQHGFVSRRSTVTNLVCFTQFLAESLDNNCQVDVVFTDFSRAFDSIDHGILVDKLKSFGLSKSLIAFLVSYLSDRRQYVEFRGYRSGEFFVTSGVPQGSNLGPLLFIMFINDITSNISVESLLYADDMKIFCRITCPDDCLRLQADIDNVFEWCSVNHLGLNAEKCKVLSFSRRRESIAFRYSADLTEIPRCDSVRDLGVTLDAGLHFDKHVESIVAAATKSLGFIIRSCRDFSGDCLKLLYFSYVRSKLEYASVIWSPYYDRYVKSIESVQRRFLKFLAYKTDGQYPPRGFDHCRLLRRFGFQPLECRRLAASAGFLHKLVHNKIDCADIFDRVQLNPNRPGCALRSQRLFYLPDAHTNVMLKSPLYVMCRVGNMVNTSHNFFEISLAALIRLISNRDV